VAEWNKQGGAPPDEFAHLKEEEKYIEVLQREVDNALTELNATVEWLNVLAGAINELSDRYNLEVALFNGRFVKRREFEQGQFDGSQMIVYQFNDEQDLTIALIHEFGHALGFQHVETPEAVMYRRLEKQDMQNIRLTEDDVRLLRDKFHR
jgi:hypothetical protein